jgi:hypothetical protein
MKLDGLRIGCKDFLMEAEARCFKKMLIHHGKTFVFELHEIGYIDLVVVALMVIFTVPNIPQNLQPILVSRAHLP